MKNKKSNSPAQRSLRRFLRNKPGLFGLVVIILSVLIAVGGYQLTPDSTPEANDQILQITNKGPGFSITLLKRAKNKQVEESNFFAKMLFGEENPYELIPIIDYELKNGRILYKEYAGSEDNYEEKELNIADVVYPLQPDQNAVKVNDGTLTFVNYQGQELSQSVVELENKLQAENISSRTFWLGTDKFGRDMLSRLIIGVRVSLSVGIIAVFISLVIGVTLGAMAGYFRGRVDDFFMWLINVIWSIPTLLLVFGIMLAFGTAFWQIYVAVGLTMWVEVARIVRGQVMSIREMQYIEAARSLAFSSRRIIWLHVLPNVMGPLIVVAAANFASAIIIEAGLSFLGIGVQPPMPSWGGMLNENYGYIIGGKPFLAIVPGIAIMLMVLAFNLVGNGFRDALDVKTSL